MGREKYFPIDFSKYLSYSEVQKNNNVVDVLLMRFQQETNSFSIFSKNTLLEQAFDR